MRGNWPGATKLGSKLTGTGVATLSKVPVTQDGSRLAAAVGTDLALRSGVIGLAGLLLLSDWT